jgi:hypothetical protein
MLERIKKLLQGHKRAYPNCTIVRVTTTRYYQIPEGTSTPVPELLKEWFKKTPVTQVHAFREHSLLIEHFEDNATVVEPDDIDLNLCALVHVCKSGDYHCKKGAFSCFRKES